MNLFVRLRMLFCVSFCRLVFFFFSALHKCVEDSDASHISTATRSWVLFLSAYVLRITNESAHIFFVVHDFIRDACRSQHTYSMNLLCRQRDTRRADLKCIKWRRWDDNLALNEIYSFIHMSRIQQNMQIGWFKTSLARARSEEMRDDTWQQLNDVNKQTKRNREL